MTGPARRGWALAGDILHSSTPVSNSATYPYTRLNLSLNRAL